MTAPKPEPTLVTTVSLLVIASVAAAAALWYTRPVMVPFVLAVFIAYLVSPIVDFLRVKCRFPKAGAVAVTILVATVLFTLLAMLVITSTRGLLANVPLYQQRVIALAQRVTAFGERAGLDIGRDAIVDGIRQFPVLELLQSWAGTAVGVVTTGVLVLIFVVYLLIGRHPQQLRRGIYAEIDSRVRNYIVIKFITSATTGVLTGVILALFGLDLALMFGVMAFLLNFIPSIGSLIATLLPLPIALFQFESGGTVLLVILLPGLVQFTIGNFVEPLLMGEGLDLHPVVILLALLFWGTLWGVVGMLLAAPMTAILRIVFSRIALTHPLAEIMAGRLPKEGFITAETLVPTKVE